MAKENKLSNHLTISCINFKPHRNKGHSRKNIGYLCESYVSIKLCGSQKKLNLLYPCFFHSLA